MYLQGFISYSQPSYWWLGILSLCLSTYPAFFLLESSDSLMPFLIVSLKT